MFTTLTLKSMMQLILGLPFFLLTLLPTTTAQLFGSIESGDNLPQLPAIPSQLSAAAHAASSVASVANAEASLMAFQNEIGISSSLPNLSLPDPCGPPSQPVAYSNSLSTCTANVTTNNTDFATPSHYGVSCQYCDGSSGHQIPNITTCKNEMIAICEKLVGFYGAPPTDQWVFGNQGGNCTLAFWLPQGGAPPPSYKRCVDQIFLLIADTCLEPKYNVGTVNLAQTPDMQAFNSTAPAGSYSTGFAVDTGYPSYIMLAQQSSNDYD